ncbi:MAG: double-strand break repair helicase AddA [Alphaproteobacteria bacterium]|nr:double-strand break repair helicase AddA [Alphaproteobacteria bacterium]
MSVPSAQRRSDKQTSNEFGADELQRLASNPHESIWVSASAGSGKTKVLTDRVLRLLLPRSNGLPATKPHKILCLTFTKSAASEMEIRIKKTLGQWAIMNSRNDNDTKNSLYHVLKKLLGDEPNEQQLLAAQRLFSEVIDSASSLQIMTIHSFCQSVLSRFPLEAGLSPNFTLLEDQQTVTLLNQAQKIVLADAQKSDSEYAAPLKNISKFINEEQFQTLIQSICSERYQFERILEQHWDINTLYIKICELYGIEPGQCADNFITQINTALNADQEAELRQAATALINGSGAKEPEYGATILEWLNASTKNRINLYGAYRNIFITGSETIRKQGFPKKSTESENPGCSAALQAEAQRILGASARLKKLHSAEATRDLLHIGHKIISEYKTLKLKSGALDFDDLIIKTLELLQGSQNFGSWVMFKLDQGLDHILVDEAQDTNPEQWKIIAALCDEFFSGYSARDDLERTCFVVGDLKQSIYSFQRAAPEEFIRMQKFLHEKIILSGQPSQSVSLDISFRSTQSILRIVDAVFEGEEHRKAVGSEKVRHSAYREGQSGRVELWPLFKSEKKEPRNFWDPPIEIMEQENSAALLSNYVAEKIAQWIENKEILPSHDRPINPGDILILVRTRSKLVDQLVRSLKFRNIPVNGVDRMILGDHLAVQDLLALGNFTLLPDDDLTLACALKSPFLNWNEDELFSLGYNRTKSLWYELQKFDLSRLQQFSDEGSNITVPSEDKRQKTLQWLNDIIEKSSANVFDFYSYIMNRPCPADPVSGLRAVLSRLGNDALDPLDEFLNVALHYSKNATDSLQGFLDSQDREKIEIKRELDQAKSQVRIMTVHASKGLQAPIVILPDTIQNASYRKTSRLLWPDKTKIDIPLWAPRKDCEPEEYSKLFENYKTLHSEEDLRLLYVAMTRAEDRLYITGHEGTRGSDENSWYHLIRKTMENDETHIACEDNILYVENLQTKEPDRKTKETVIRRKKEGLPQWIRKKARPVKQTAKSLTPSTLEADTTHKNDYAVMMSPLQAKKEFRFKRGNITHKLLEFLPELPVAKRREAAHLFTQKYASDLPEDIQTDIVKEVMNILEHPEYQAFFSENSLAEISTTGFTSDKKNIMNAQIDRLVIKDNTIWILDYKSNRPSPKKPENIPEIYRKQIESYKDIIREIYPDHDIKAALLWTDGPHLMIIK